LLGTLQLDNLGLLLGERYCYYSGTKLHAMTWENGAKMLSFLYDSSGAPYSMVYCYTESGVKYSSSYYYVTNLQGDVVALMNANHEIVAEYLYDAWGNILSVTNGNGYELSPSSYHIANFNPLRYRGYVYDNETGFYYLQSRYYDPVVGRFVSIDNTVSGVNGPIIGYNLFAYGFNNPTNLDDSSGNWPKWVNKIKESVTNTVEKVKNKVSNAYSKVKTLVNNVKTDKKNFDLKNQDESVVLESNYFSAYKGIPVIRTNGERSGSFGAIFLTKETNDRKHPEDVVRHEYGHTQQLAQLGIVTYALCIGVPSWQEWGTGEYYTKPWEITADIYGDVQSRIHSQTDIDKGFEYLEGSKKTGILIWMFIE